MGDRSQLTTGKLNRVGICGLESGEVVDVTDYMVCITGINNPWRRCGVLCANSEKT